MELIKFKSHEHYLRAQRRTLNRRGYGPYFSLENINDTCDWFDAALIREQYPGTHIQWPREPRHPQFGLCHGARCGRESDAFLARYPTATILGTDIEPKSGKTAQIETKTKVVQYDFMTVNSEWIGKADFVYSNSFDHVSDPIKALNIWLDQLTPAGFLFLHWFPQSIPVKDGDCFGAHLDEYMGLVEEVGQVVDLIFSYGTGRRGSGMSVIVVGKKEKRPSLRKLRRQKGK